jgi:Golgi SNAP receptor complex protein 1
VQEKVNTGDDMFKTMSMEIQSLLGRLQEINQKLSDFHSTNGLGTSNASMMHTLQRHRDILQDFQHEFNKIKGNIETQREREDLLGSVRRDIDNHYRQQQQIRDRTNGQGGSGSNDMFISERDRLLRSNQEAEYAIQVGLEAREGLRHQRQQMQGMTGRVMGIMQKFPLINGLVHRINWRKKRDSLIMAGVISTCLILILLYWLRV